MHIAVNLCLTVDKYTIFLHILSNVLVRFNLLPFQMLIEVICLEFYIQFYIETVDVHTHAHTHMQIF